MSQIIQAQLEIEGYDAITATEIVKTVEKQTDDVAKDYLSDLVESQAAIDRYIRARAKRVPESRKPEAQAAIDKTKAPKWAGNPKSSARPPQTSRTSSAMSSAASSPGPSRSGTPQPVLKVNNKSSTTPYSRGGFGFKVQPQKQQQQQQAQKESNKANRQYKIDAITDLDAAIKKLDLANSSDRKPCDCMGSVHGLLEMAPNCLECGKVVCNKEGLGNCLGCGRPLIPTSELESIYSILNEQRDAIVSSMGKNALKQAGINPQLSKAQENLDRLLGYQASEAQRTKIIDQAEDFETPDLGTNQWATPLEQARQLRNQQRQQRKQDELRKIKRGRGKKVVSIAIRGNQIVEEVADHYSSSSDSDSEPKDETENQPQEEEAQQFWDASKYGTNFVEPLYKSSDSLSLPKQQKGTTRNVVAYDEEQAFRL